MHLDVPNVHPYLGTCTRQIKDGGNGYIPLYKWEKNYKVPYQWVITFKIHILKPKNEGFTSDFRFHVFVQSVLAPGYAPNNQELPQTPSQDGKDRLPTNVFQQCFSSWRIQPN